MKKNVFLLLLLLCSFIVTSSAQDLILKGGTILTITHGTVENGTIIIRGGKIVAIGKEIAVPVGVPVLDMSGKFVMPGIIDTHTHVAFDITEIGESEKGGDSVFAEIWMKDALVPDHYSIPLLLAGGISTVKTMYGSGHVIGGVNATIKLKYNTSMEEMLIDDARPQLKMALGENPKARKTTPPSTRMGIAHLLRDVFTQAKDYKEKWDRYEQELVKNKDAIPPEKLPDMETIKLVLEKKIAIDCHAYRAEEMVWMINFCREFDIVLKQFSHCIDGYKIADILAGADVSYGGWVDRWGYKEEAYDNNPWGFKLMYEAGVNIVLNTDTVVPPDGARYLYQDCSKVLKYNDIPEEDVLKMITLNAAKVLEIDHRTGSLEVGKDGDIAVFDKHPLDSTTKCVLTVIEGEIYYDYQRDSIHANGGSDED